MSIFSGSAFDAAERALTKGGTRFRIPEFYLKAGETKEVVFCDDDPPMVNGHKVTVLVKDGIRVPRWYTCSQGVADCVLCEKKFSRTFVGPMTVLVDNWTERDGEATRSVKWPKRILMASRETLLKLKAKKEFRKKLGEPGLVGGLFSISRISKRNQIDDCEFLRRVKPGDIGVPDFSPLNYEEYLAPRSRDEILDTMARFEVRDGFVKIRPAESGSGFEASGKKSDVVEY